MNTCAGCGAGMTDHAVICPDCVNSLDELLRRVPSTVDDLRVSVERRDVGEPAVGIAASPEPRLPVNFTAADALHDLTECLRIWAKRVACSLSIPGYEGHDPSGYAGWLCGALGQARFLDYVTQLDPALTRLLGQCTRRLEADMPRVFAGSCGNITDGVACGRELFAVRGEPTAVCTGCGTGYDVAKWQAHALTLAKYHIDTPTRLSVALANPRYGIDVSSDLIRKWAGRGKLARVNPLTDDDGVMLKPLYRLNDVLDVWFGMREAA